jgi:hypothetical protein
MEEHNLEPRTSIVGSNHDEIRVGGLFYALVAGFFAIPTIAVALGIVTLAANGLSQPEILILPAAVLFLLAFSVASYSASLHAVSHTDWGSRRALTSFAPSAKYAVAFAALACFAFVPPVLNVYPIEAVFVGFLGLTLLSFVFPRRVDPDDGQDRSNA